jgi:ribonuclease P protein component
MPECRPSARRDALLRAARLRTPEQFAAASGERATWRATRQWLVASARVDPPGAGPERLQAAAISGDSLDNTASPLPLKPKEQGVRFGLTVGRRQARRAVERAMVKRVLREAVRNAAGTLGELVRDRNLDLVLKLRAPLPERCEMSLAQVKRSLRTEADALIGQLARHLRAGAR